MKNYLDRYLAGEAPLHPERLAVPADEELDAAEATFDRLMAGQEPSTTTKYKPRRRAVSLWRWAAAASLLLIIGTGAVLWVMKDLGAQETETMVAKTIHENPPHHPSPRLTGRQSPREVAKDQFQQPKAKTLVKPKAVRKEIPDTLGNGIWKSERNVQIALQMLGECEAVIEKSEQEMRNTIVKATFNATPQPANAVLVTNEAGDFEVIETKTIIEI